VDDVRLGRLLRALRLRRGLRQRDIAAAAGASQSLISLVERGHLSKLSLARLRSVFGAVDARFEGTLSWRGGSIDRLLDEGHARLGGSVTAALVASQWAVDPEATFNDYGDRGSIDLLATRQSLGLALVVEIKTELTSVEETIRRLDVKQRVAPSVVFDRFGWRPAATSRILVLLDGATNRRRVAAHDASLAAAFPVRGVVARRWLREPSGRVSALTFWSVTNPGSRRPAQPRSDARQGLVEVQPPSVFVDGPDRDARLDHEPPRLLTGGTEQAARSREPPGLLPGGQAAGGQAAGAVADSAGATVASTGASVAGSGGVR